MSKLWLILSGILGFVTSFALYNATSGCVVATANDLIGMGFTMLLFGVVLWIATYWAVKGLIVLPSAISRWLRRRAERRVKLKKSEYHSRLTQLEYETVKIVVYVLLGIIVSIALLIGLAYLVGYLHIFIVC